MLNCGQLFNCSIVQKMKRYELLDHTADIGLVAHGKDLKELFENAAYGMFDIIADIKKIKPKKLREIKVKAPNLEELFLSWLRELLFQFDAKGFLFGKFKIEDINDGSLTAKCAGEKLDLKKQEMRREVKAVTYCDFELKKVKLGWRARVIFDV